MKKIIIIAPYHQKYDSVRYLWGLFRSNFILCYGLILERSIDYFPEDLSNLFAISTETFDKTQKVLQKQFEKDELKNKHIYFLKDDQLSHLTKSLRLRQLKVEYKTRRLARGEIEETQRISKKHKEEFKDKK